MPPVSGITLHPYDLFKNPYQAMGKLVLIDLNSRPILYNGAVIQYSGPVNPAIGVRFGLMALSLNRMTEENVALYNIMGIEAGESDGEVLGQLAVVLPDGVAELRLDRNWMVEPLGPLKGTNYFGAGIQIPAVRFWRYSGEGDESTGQENLGATSKAEARSATPSESDSEIRDAVEGWANAFRARDADHFAAYYAPEVEQFFRKKDVSRSQIHDTYQSTFGKMNSINTYEISGLRVEFPEGEASPARATATYHKTWDTSQTDGKRFSGEEIERLTFEKTDEGWKIVREDELQVLRTSRQ
jgi:ketosteroid isomerase-like protein